MEKKRNIYNYTGSYYIHFDTLHKIFKIFLRISLYHGDSIFCIVISSFVEPLVTARLCVLPYLTLCVKRLEDRRLTCLSLKWAQNASDDHTHQSVPA
jgi:uncharacterized membrane protein YhaH (DUF805 family)